MAIDDRDFPVVPVVEPGRQHGDKGVKPAALYAHRLKLAVIAEGKGHDGAHVIVDHAYIHARFCLFLEDFQYGIPHDARFNDEVLKENVALRTLEGFYHGRKLILPYGEVFCIGVFVRRAIRVVLDVMGLAGCIWIFCFQLRKDFIVGLEDVRLLLLHAVHPLPQVSAHAAAAEH